MDKMQRKELMQAVSELKRAQNAKQARKNAGESSRTGLGFNQPSEEFIRSSEEMEHVFELAENAAVEAFQVVETYGDKVFATKLRIDAILGR